MKEKPQNKFLVWLANFLGPKLDKYRIKAEPEEPELPKIYLPETEEDLVWVLKKLPEKVLPEVDRQKIMMAMTFSSKKVRDVMLKREKITFVHINDFMGPLMLDKLYQSGYAHFPVVDTKGGIAGVIHTSSLNSLKIKDTDRAASFLDNEVYYMRDDYTLAEAMAAFIRTNSYFFMVINYGGQVVGLLTFEAMVEKLLGEIPKDNFSADDNLMAVAKR